MNPTSLFPHSKALQAIEKLDVHPKLKMLLGCMLRKRKPPRALFDSDASYYYHLYYVKPKIATCGKAIVVSELRDGKRVAFTHLRFYVSNSYVLLVVNIKVDDCDKDLTDCRSPPWYVISSRRYLYLYGVNGDSVFVNEVHIGPVSYESLYEEGPIEIYKTADQDIKMNVLGYMYDCDSENVRISTTGSYRVQGDIVLRVMKDIDMTDIRDQLARHLELLKLDIVNRILLSKGLSPVFRFNNRHNCFELVFEFLGPRYGSVDYLEKLKALLSKELKELGYGLSSIGDKCGLAGYHVCEGPRRRYCDVILNIECRRDSKELDELVNELTRTFDNLPFTNIEFNIGNHHVKMSNVKSLSFTFKPSKQPLSLNENIIFISRPLTYHVTPRTEITMTHPEHGIINITFADHFYITFDHVFTPDTFTIWRNRAILRALET
jgi:hypothetical protein